MPLTCSTSKRSWPAGTGVWVVKTVVRRISSLAASNEAPAGNQLARPLQQHEGRVTFIGVPASRGDAQGAEHPHAADAEDPLLAETHVDPAGVELARDATIVGVIRLDIGVEQVERRAAHRHGPDTDVHRTAERSRPRSATAGRRARRAGPAGWCRDSPHHRSPPATRPGRPADRSSPSDRRGRCRRTAPRDPTLSCNGLPQGRRGPRSRSEPRNAIPNSAQK